MRIPARTSVLSCLLATMLAGCGGGISIAFFDDDGFFRDDFRGDGLHLPHGDSELRASVVALALFDSLAGIERLMAAAGAHAQLAGAAGTSAERACASGSIVTRKTAATTFVLEARQCQLVAGDPLLYDGSWLFVVQSNVGHAADGSCPAATSCVLTATLDSASARFGYGRAAMRATGSNWRQETSTAGVLQVQAQASGASTFIDGVEFRPTGTLASLSAQEFSLSGDSTRRTLTTTAPVHATISTDAAGLVSAVDENGDGQADRSLSLDWDRIVD
ncbi:hypothetical protein [Ramlibacter sp.]|uniref:hypothetical protein n=1 Tax=Ramlibacter sp. TaxID=1917967 RepID=UPI002D2CB317|nr:hypothetical protein [Ramlibacter sp.]HYD77940.1 hypothetical protein [Ramlibacter sp.]